MITVLNESISDMLARDNVVSSWVKEEPTVDMFESTLGFSITMKDASLRDKLLILINSLADDVDYFNMVDTRELKGNYTILVVIDVDEHNWQGIKEDFEARYIAVMKQVGLTTGVYTMFPTDDPRTKDAEMMSSPFVLKTGWALDEPIGGIIGYGITGSIMSSEVILSVVGAVKEKYGEEVSVEHEVEGTDLTVMMFFDIDSSDYKGAMVDITNFINGHLEEHCAKLN